MNADLISQAILAGVVLLGGLGGLALLAANRTFAFRAWIVVVALCPPWIYPAVGGVRIPVAFIMSVAVLVAFLPKSRPRWCLPDTAVLALSAVTVLAFVAGGTPLHIALQACLEWGSCYAAGRVVNDRRLWTGTIRVVAVLLGAGALLQAALHFNVADFPGLSVASGPTPWMTLQERVGLTRAELTFGHSIALGGTLALMLPFVLLDEMPRRRALVASIVLLGLLATLSRASIIGGVVGLGFAIFRSRISGVAKVVGLTALMLAGLAGSSLFTSRLAEGNYSTEVQTSTQYREDLLDLIPILRPIGLAPGGIPIDGGATFRWLNFYSIDNALLLVGLYAGFVAAVLYVVPLAWLAVRGVQVREERVVLAVVLTQIPLVLTVAPITQYQSFFWLVLGHVVTRIPNSGMPELDEVRRGSPKRRRVLRTP